MCMFVSMCMYEFSMTYMSMYLFPFMKCCHFNGSPLFSAIMLLMHFLNATFPKFCIFNLHIPEFPESLEIKIMINVYIQRYVFVYIHICVNVC